MKRSASALARPKWTWRGDRSTRHANQPATGAPRLCCFGRPDRVCGLPSHGPAPGFTAPCSQRRLGSYCKGGVAGLTAAVAAQRSPPPAPPNGAALARPLLRRARPAGHRQHARAAHRVAGQERVGARDGLPAPHGALRVAGGLHAGSGGGRGWRGGGAARGQCPAYPARQASGRVCRRAGAGVCACHSSRPCHMHFFLAARCRPSNRSIFGLPMLSCTAPAYRAWSLCILVLDLTYSAFLLPITIGMQVGGCRPRAPANHGLSGERGSTAQMGRLC